MTSMRLILALGASLVGGSALVSPASAQALPHEQLHAQVVAACAISLEACQAALAQAIAALPLYPPQSQAAFGALLAQTALANPGLAPLIADALEVSSNPVLVASYNATHGGALETVVIPVASPA